MRLLGITRIFGFIPDSVLGEIKNHPMRGDLTQNDLYTYIFRMFNEIPFEFFEQRAVNGKASQQELAALELWKQRRKSAELNLAEGYTCPHCKSHTSIVSQTALTDFGFRILNLKCGHAATQKVNPLGAQSGNHCPAVPSQSGNCGSQQAASAVSATSVTGGNTSGDVEGDFIVSLSGGDYCEVEGRSFVDLRWQVVGGPHNGRILVDRVLDFPITVSGNHCRVALGLEPGNSLAKNHSNCVGRQVQIRRTKKEGRDGVVRIKIYYYPMPRIRMVR